MLCNSDKYSNAYTVAKHLLKSNQNQALPLYLMPGCFQISQTFEIQKSQTTAVNDGASQSLYVMPIIILQSTNA